MNKLTRSEFVETVIKELEKEFGEGNVVLTNDLKVNNVKREGFAILGTDKKASPVIPVGQYYEAYSNGSTTEELINDIKETYKFFDERFGIQEKPDLSFDNVKDRIVFHVVGQEAYAKRLKNLVSMKLPGGLAMVYAININDNHAMMITKEIARDYGYNLEKVHDTAEKNTPKLFPATLMSLEESVGVFPEDRPTLNEMDENVLLSDTSFVLSNNTNINGATVLFYPETREKIAKMLGGDFYAIPSSVHEFMIVSCDAGLTAEYLEDVLVGANENVVKAKDKLSDKLLRYDAESKHLEFAIPEPVKDKSKAMER